MDLEDAMGIELRAARVEDKPRILEISSQVWEGTDYVPLVLDLWLADEAGQFLVALIDGKVVGFAHRTYLAPGYAWLEGARTDVAYRGQGAGKAIARRFLEDVKSEGAERIGLSTHLTNEASLHLIRAHGFQEIAWFTNLGAENETPTWPQAQRSNRVVTVPLAEAVEFVRGSRSLLVGRGFTSAGWTFYPFDRAPDGALRLSAHLLGVRDGTRLVGLFAGGYARQGHLYPVHFLEGSEEAIEILLRHAFHLAVGCRYIDMMTPGGMDSGLPSVPVALKLGLKTWVETTPDVLVFERTP